MKILAVTDIHGANYKVVDMLIRETPDLLIIGGDLTTYGSVHDVENALNIFKNNCPKMLCISGNMDAKEHDAFYTKAGISINGKGFIVGDIGIFGASAAPFSALRTPYEISEDDIYSLIQQGYKDVIGARLEILVSHAPPEGTALDMLRSGEHVGSTAVRKFIETEQPAVAVCGHIHEARGKDTLGSTTIVNCGVGSKGYYAVISIVEGEVDIKNKQL